MLSIVSSGSILGLLRGNVPECNVEVQIATQSYLDNILPSSVGLPKCHKNLQALRQVVVGYHDYNNGSDETCFVQLTEENWNSTFQ